MITNRCQPFTLRAMTRDSVDRGAHDRGTHIAELAEIDSSHLHLETLLDGLTS